MHDGSHMAPLVLINMNKKLAEHGHSMVGIQGSSV